MITITKALVQSPRVATPLGVTSRRPQSVQENSDFSSTSAAMPGLGPNVTISSNPITVDLDPMLTGITPQIEQAYFHRLYRDMYYHDPVAGSAVDMITALPFSEFSLGGVASDKVLSTFLEPLERLNLRTALPEMGVDYLVLGAHCSSLLSNPRRKAFTDLMPHAIENLTIDSLPFYSQDPVITANFPDSTKSLLSRDTPRIRKLKEYLGSSVIDSIMTGSIELEPLSTLYIPRKTFSHTTVGTSYYRRILPIYLIEKSLYRGTLVESSRRQRGITHITLGDGDQWEPTTADMAFITDLFMNADSDPLGAIIATRLGVSTEELRQGGDFWKHGDFADSMLSHKTRALGISEGLLSGEANYATADTSLTVFIEMLRSFRDMFTRKIFYNKIFPLISLMNGYTLNSSGKLMIKDGLMNDMSHEEALFRMNDGSKLLIPTVTWSKQLKPEGDSSYLEMLNTMTEKGVPVPIRVLAAAGGLNVEELLRAQDDDLSMRKRIQDYMAKVAAFASKSDEESAEASSLIAMSSDDPSGRHRGSVIASGGRVPLFSRDFGSASELTAKTRTGKLKAVHNQAKANRKINVSIAKALKAADARGAFRTSVSKIKGKK